MFIWLKQRRKHSYQDLWYLVYGGRDEGDKGLLREVDWAHEISIIWQQTAVKQTAALARVKELHKESPDSKCKHCKTKYPCKTIRTMQQP